MLHHFWCIWFFFVLNSFWVHICSVFIFLFLLLLQHMFFFSSFFLKVHILPHHGINRVSEVHEWNKLKFICVQRLWWCWCTQWKCQKNEIINWCDTEKIGCRLEYVGADKCVNHMLASDEREKKNDCLLKEIEPKCFFN